MTDENQSLLGLTLDELGKPVVMVTHRDGTVETSPLEQTTVRTGEPAPHTWRQAGPALEPRDKAGLSRRERVEQSLRVEAALVKGFASPTGVTVSDRHCRLILREVLLAMGGEWAEQAGGI